MREKHCLLLIAAAGAMLFFSFLGVCDLWNPDEPRDAEIAREIHVSGNYIVPTLNGEPFLEKPPLFYWLVNLISFRGITETSARLPSAFFAALGMLLAFYIGKNVYGEKTGLFSALLLPCFFQYWWMGRRSSLDMTFSFFVSAALYFFYKSYFTQKNPSPYFILFYVCAAFAALTKGLLGIVLIGAAILPFLALQRNIKFIFQFHAVYGALIFCAIFFAWVFSLWQQGGNALLHEFFVVNHLERFSGKFGGHNQPFYYYFQTLVADFLPWSIFLPFVISFLKNEPGNLSAEKRIKFYFLLSWVLGMLAILTISKSKREIYLLPLYAPLAVLYAAAFTRIHEYKLLATFKVVRGFSTIFACIPVLVFFAVIAVKIYSTRTPGFLVFLFLPAACAFLLYKAARAKSFLLLVHGALATLFILFASSPGFILKELNPYLSARPFASAFRSQLSFHEIDIHKTRLFMFNVPEGMQGSYLFYFKRTMPLVAEEETMLAVAKEKPFTCFLMKKEDYDNREKTLLPYLFPFIVSETKGQRDAVAACNKKLQAVYLNNGNVIHE